MIARLQSHFQTVLILAVLLLAALGATVFAQDFTQGYGTDESLPRGSVIGLSEEDQNKVEKINLEQIDSLFGVVVSANDSAVTLTDEESVAFVTTGGRFEVLMTDVNGRIEAGDLITISPFDGIAMKSDGRHKLVLGRSLQDMDLSNPDNIISQVDVTDDNGVTVKASITRLLAEIEVRANPDVNKNDAVPQFLLEIATTVADKPVSALRIYAGLAVLVIASAVSGSLLYSAVRSAIISIGRNPLSKRSVLRGMFQVVFIAILIFLSGLVAVYLILRI